MKKLLALLFWAAQASNGFSWGFLGHQTINCRAVYALPPGMFGFYKTHIDYITRHSTDPDNRRYIFDGEGCRHFIDCDHYEKKTPLDSIEKNWFKAVEKYGEDSLKAHGIVPWHCNLMIAMLTNAFKEKDVQKILKISADLGHYVADAHVPLHTSSNYNGQKSQQEGIHALWESRIPKVMLDSFDLLTGTANYLTNANAFIWSAVETSYGLVDSVLLIEKRISSRHLHDKYEHVQASSGMQKNYGEQFCLDYENAMNQMVEKRMQQAIMGVASFWYTAWVNAGMPDLETIQADTKNASKNDVLPLNPGSKIKGREEPDAE